MNNPYAPYCPQPQPANYEAQRARLQRLIDLLDCYDLTRPDADTSGLASRLREFNATAF
jgi:hypothetical protein